MPPAVRVGAERDAEAGRAASDVHVATTAAAYGGAEGAWLRRSMLLWALALPVGLAVGLAVGHLADGPRGGGTAFMTVFTTWLVVGLVTTRWWRRLPALQQLHAANQLAVDGRHHPGTHPDSSPGPAPTATAAVQDTVEIRRRRGPYLAITVVAAVCSGYPIIFEVIDDTPEGWLFYTLTAAVIAVIVIFAWFTWRDLRHPVIARFTPTGWALPPYRLDGGWDQIQAITVRTHGPLDLRKLPTALQAMPRLTGVCLTIPGLQPDPTHVPWDRRRAYRLTVQAFDTPAVIVVDRTTDHTAAQIVEHLTRYTTAPVHWG